MLPSQIVFNGAMIDPASLLAFLSNPTFPAGMTSLSSVSLPLPNNINPLKVANIPLGPVALASIGTNTADVLNQWWMTDIFVPYTGSFAKIGVLQGGTATTDNIQVAIWDSSGKLVGNSAAAGVLLSGANTFKELTLAAPVTLSGPGYYVIGVVGNGTAAGAIQTLASPNIMNRTAILAGTFGTVPATITMPTAWTTGQGPVVYLGN